MFIVEDSHHEYWEGSLTLDSLEKRGYMQRDRHKSLHQRFTQPARKHEVQLIMEMLCQVGPNCSGEHTDALKNWFFGRSVLSPMNMLRTSMYGEMSRHTPSLKGHS